MEKDVKIPVHVAIIMDGNGRWAKKRGFPRSVGHKHGMQAMITLAEEAFTLGVRYFTVYALSTENFSRPQEELDGLFHLFRRYFTEYVDKISEKGIGLNILGDITLLPEDIQRSINLAVEKTAGNQERIINIALAYGARAEILRAAKQAIKEGVSLTEENFSSLLYTSKQPDPDLIIRTGGEKRLSNFLLWQAAYAELYFSDVLFPDFGKEDLAAAIEEFSRRHRRFGKTQEQIDDQI